jgi:hypothetical protein
MRALPIRQLAPDTEQLPALYAGWLRDVLPGPIPRERRATCDACAMVPREGREPAEASAQVFNPATKCCTYLPELPNFLVGALLSDQAVAPAGRASVEARMAQGIGVTPLGLHKTPLYSTIYANSSSATFGQAMALRCPHYVEESGACGIWQYRDAICSTWFCKHERGKVGATFWRALSAFLRVIEVQVALRCAADAGAGTSTVLQALNTRSADAASLLGAELVTSQNDAFVNTHWQQLPSGPETFYMRCYDVARHMSWSEIRALGGEELRLRERVLLDAYADLVTTSLPERLAIGPVEATRINADWYQVISYSGYDPVAIPSSVWNALAVFDGRPTMEALDALPPQAFQALLQNDLIHRLVENAVLASPLPS